MTAGFPPCAWCRQQRCGACAELTRRAGGCAACGCEHPGLLSPARRRGRPPIRPTAAQIALIRARLAEPGRKPLRAIATEAGMSEDRLIRVMDEVGIPRAHPGGWQPARNSEAARARLALAALQAAGASIPPHWQEAARLRIENPAEPLAAMADRIGVSKHVLAGRLRRLLKAGGQR